MTEEQVLKLKNWRNLFKFEGWKKEIIWIIIILLLVYSYWAYQKDMEICFHIVENPCEYCFTDKEMERTRQGGRYITFDIPNISEFKMVNNSSLNAT